jgi:phosphoribosylformylglycinamidine cyclo-ligase
MSLTYEQSGVSIKTASETIESVKSSIKSTYNKHVLSSTNSFGSAFSLKSILHDFDDPVLVQSTDGVGTKLIIAKMMNDFSTVGQDVVANNVNDILCIGAKPITFLDYIGCSILDKNQIGTIISNIADECKKIDVALVGGEMAEMPGVYVSGEVDVVGMVTGIVERSKIITGENVVEGDVGIGLLSSGLHTNGYSLARKALFEIVNLSPNDTPELLEGKTLGEALLTPHKNYFEPINKLLTQGIDIEAIAHITGGGIIGNISRVIPSKLSLVIDPESYAVPNIFNLIQSIANISEIEMYKTFNMGIGMIIIVKPEDANEVICIINQCKNQKAILFGEVRKKLNIA